MSQLLRYEIDHFSGFWPEHIDEVAEDQVNFVRRHLVHPKDGDK